jgi:phosphoglucosamine mutase
MSRIFGTDGVRGVANEFLTPELAFALGRAGGFALAAHGERRPVLVGRDTRCSGPMLEEALTAGVTSVGLDVWKLGIVPTPGVAFLTRHLEAAAGVMISASHNPIEDNGIKFFASDGCKLPDALEDEIGAHVEGHHKLPRPTGADVGSVFDRRRSVGAYVRHCVGLGRDLGGRTVVIDGAYGAAFDVGPKVFAQLGATVIPLHCRQDGRRINVKCGATDLSSLREAVRNNPGSVGVAFDGDADRALFVDENGRDVTGDHVLAMWAKDLLAADALPRSTVVATVMSNLGLEIAMRELGVTMLRTAVGDRYVLEEMQRGGYRLGGEQSGHIIDLESNTTGDGIATAVRVLSLVGPGTTLAELASIVTTYPQILVNVRVKDKTCLEVDEPVKEAVAAAERALAGHGRLLVRPSGTEPLVRIMIEGQDEAEMHALAATIAERIQAAQPSS